MLHIFDKVYLAYAETSLGLISADKFPDKFIRVIDKDLLSVTDRDFQENQINFGKNLSELLSNYEHESDLFSSLSNLISNGDSRKIKIYADENSFVEFAIRWWKAILPNLTAEGGYSLYSVFGDSEFLRSSKSHVFLDITKDSSRISFTELSDLYWGMGKEKFTEKFNSLKGFEISSEIKNKCGIEFLLIDYIASGTKEPNSELNEKIEHIYNKKFIKEITDSIKLSQEYIYHLASDESDLKEGGKLNGSSMRSFLEKSEKYKFILDDKIINSKSGWDYVSSNYDLKDLSKILLDFDLKVSEKLGLDKKGVELDNPCLSFYSKNGKNPESSYIASEEIAGSSKFRIFYEMSKTNKVNPYLILAFNNLIKEEPNSKLVKEFLL